MLWKIISITTNVHGIIVPLSGHWIPEEQPQFVIKQLSISLAKIIHTNTK